MNDDPAEVDVLYAQVNDPTDRKYIIYCYKQVKSGVKRIRVYE